MHVADEIKDAGWERQLSSGVVLTGGGALLSGMTEIAEQVFDAPVRVGYPGARSLWRTDRGRSKSGMGRRSWVGPSGESNSSE